MYGWLAKRQTNALLHVGFEEDFVRIADLFRQLILGLRYYNNSLANSSHMIISTFADSAIIIIILITKGLRKGPLVMRVPLKDGDEIIMPYT